MNGRKLGIAGGIVALLVVVFAGVSFLNAGNMASEYEKSFTAWNTEKKAKLLTTTSTLPENMYVYDFDQVTEEQGLELQKKGCDTVGATLQEVKKTEETVPKLGVAFLGSLNSKYAAAQKQAEERTKTIRAYTEKAKTSYEKIVTDCKWNYGYNMGAKPSHEAYKKVRATYVKQGERGDGWICKNDKGCTPVSPEKRAAYVEAHRQYITLSAENDAKWFKDDVCKNTSYGSEGCKKVADAGKKYDAATHAYLDAFATQPVGSAEVDAKNAGINESHKIAIDATVALYKELFPKNNVPQELSSASAGSDVFLDAVARARIADLIAAQAALKSLK